MFRGLGSTVAIQDEVEFFDSLSEVQIASTDSPVRMEYNAIVHCRKGHVLLEVGGSQQVRLHEGQLLLVPAHKLMQPMMVSEDVDAGVLMVSDRVLRSVLGQQIGIWNRAMYLNETYVIDSQRWSDALYLQSQNVFRGRELALQREFVLAFLRISLLIICEELLHQQAGVSAGGGAATDREKLLFGQFLSMLQREQLKHRQVSYYAEQLCITSKYLLSVCRHVSGKSPMRWITDSVMEDCYQLLRNTDLTVKEVSNQLGFPNSSFFGQYFREQSGLTPIAYRNKYKGY